MLVGGAYVAFRRHRDRGAVPAGTAIGMVSVRDADFLRACVRDERGVKHAVWDATRMTDSDRRHVADAVTSANRVFQCVHALETGGAFAVGLAASDAHVCFKFVALAIECGLGCSGDVVADARRWLEVSLAVYEHADFTEVGLDGLVGAMRPALRDLCSGEAFADELK